MDTLASLKKQVARTQGRIAAFVRDRTRAQRRVIACDREIAVLTGGAERASKPSAKLPRPVRGALADFLLRQRLPATVALLAALSRRVGFSGKANAVAAAAVHDARLRLTKDKKVARRK